jgi:hypothetical protein
MVTLATVSLLRRVRGNTTRTFVPSSGPRDAQRVRDVTGAIAEVGDSHVRPVASDVFAHCEHVADGLGGMSQVRQTVPRQPVDVAGRGLQASS